MSIPTILSIKKNIDEMEQNLKTFVPKKHAEQHFGSENEYDAQSLKNGLKNILSELRSLVKAPIKFLRLSSHEERHAIINSLTNINSHLVAKDYSTVATTWDGLKQSVRLYDPRNSSESAESLIERMDTQHDVCNQLEGKRDEAEQSRAQIEEIREKSESEAKRLDAASEKLTALEEKASQANQTHQKIQASGEEINKILTEAHSEKEKLSSVSESINEREERLKEQEQKTQEYNGKLDEYIQQQKQYLEEAENLIKEARNALKYTTAKGISEAFRARYEEEEAKNSKWWLAGAVFFITVALASGYFMLVGQTNLTAGMAIARFTVISVVFYAVWFCAAQYTRHKNTLDDYGYKSVLAKSMVAFLDELKEPKEREEYLSMVLMQIGKDPLRKRHDVDTPTSGLFGMFGSRKKTQ